MSGTLTDASQAFRPSTSVRSKKRAVAWCLGSPSYKGSAFVSHGLRHVVAFLPSAAFDHLLLHSHLAHLAISVEPLLCVLRLPAPSCRLRLPHLVQYIKDTWIVL